MDLDRARRAQALLSDKDVSDAMSEIEQDIVSTWRAAKTVEDRERAWSDMNAVARLRDRLKTYASDLRFAKQGDGR